LIVCAAGCVDYLWMEPLFTPGLNAPNFYPERSRGFEAATERGADALTRGIRLKTRSPGLKSGATKDHTKRRSFHDRTDYGRTLIRMRFPFPLMNERSFDLTTSTKEHTLYERKEARSR
jgi:hypothetical protein